MEEVDKASRKAKKDADRSKNDEPGRLPQGAEEHRIQSCGFTTGNHRSERRRLGAHPGQTDRADRHRDADGHTHAARRTRSAKRKEYGVDELDDEIAREPGDRNSPLEWPDL